MENALFSAFIIVFVVLASVFAIGALIAYLASQHSGYVTGQSWLIDGGEYPGTY